MSASAALPPKPIVFHGRDAFVEPLIRLLDQNETARIAILGAGGLGKTTIALWLLHDAAVSKRYGKRRLFISCEAFVSADAIIVALANRIGLSASSDLLEAVLDYFEASPRTLLLLDNIETVWLVGGPVAAVESLLGRLSQITSISLIITCRGIVLPQFVNWSNASNATLGPFSLEAALESFQDRAGRRLSGADEETAKELIRAVDMMPLAVTLLSQLAQRGNTVHNLLARWNREHTALRSTSGEVTRNNSMTESILLSIKMVSEADKSQESIKLLSVCAMLPDGMFPDVFEKMRPHFENIDLAGQTLCDFALISIGILGELKPLSPVRHFVQERHPAQSKHCIALRLIYCDIARALPGGGTEAYVKMAAKLAPEMGNMSSVLLTLVVQPSQEIVDAVTSFTHFMRWQRPTVAIALALLSHLESHPLWKADCLQAIGRAQYQLGEFRSAIGAYTTAAQLYIEADNSSLAALCKREAGSTHEIFHEYDEAESLIEEARALYAELGNDLGEAGCVFDLGGLARCRGHYVESIERLQAAKQTFTSHGWSFEVAQSSESLGITYRDHGDFESAVFQLNASRSTFFSLGDRMHMAQSTRHLGSARRRQGNFIEAERLLQEASQLYTEDCDTFGLAMSSREFGQLRRDQGRLVEAIVYWESAQRDFAVLGMHKETIECRKEADILRSRTHE